MLCIVLALVGGGGKKACCEWKFSARLQDTNGTALPRTPIFQCPTLIPLLSGCILVVFHAFCVMKGSEHKVRGASPDSSFLTHPNKSQRSWGTEDMLFVLKYEDPCNIARLKKVGQEVVWHQLCFKKNIYIYFVFYSAPARGLAGSSWGVLTCASFCREQSSPQNKAHLLLSPPWEFTATDAVGITCFGRDLDWRRHPL